MTEVLVEEGELDAGDFMIFRDLGRRVRLMFDPRRIVEAVALSLLCTALPRLIGAMKVIHHVA